MKIPALFVVPAVSILFLSASIASADDLTLGLSVRSSVDQVTTDEVDRTSTNAPGVQALADNYDGSFAGGSGGVTYGSAVVHGSSSVPGTGHDHIGNGGSSIVNARYRQSYTLRTANGAPGTAHFTMLGSGGASGSSADQSGASYTVSVDDGLSAIANYGVQVSGGQTIGDPVPSVFHFDYPFNSDVPFTLVFSAGVNVGAASHTDEGSASASASAMIRFEDLEVLDSNNQQVDYVLETPTGIGKGQTFTNGESYTDFQMTNDKTVAPNSHGTKVNLLDGLAKINGQLRGGFIGALEDVVIKKVSDSVGFTGTGTNLVVMQLDYDPASVQSQGVTEAALRLLWRNPTTLKLVNAVAGNSGGNPKLVKRAYNPATDFHLGTFGIDVAHHTVWAVVNHNSEFVVGDAPDAVLLHVDSVTRPNATTVHLNCKGEPDAPNRLETSSDLSPGSWTTVATVNADAEGVFQYDDTNAGGSQKFYRIAYP